MMAMRLMKDADEDLETRFELNDTLYATATVPPSNEVYLWLGVCCNGSDADD